jgi:hypothetical protein
LVDEVVLAEKTGAAQWQSLPGTPAYAGEPSAAERKRIVRRRCRQVRSRYRNVAIAMAGWDVDDATNAIDSRLAGDAEGIAIARSERWPAICRSTGWVSTI